VSKGIRRIVALTGEFARQSQQLAQQLRAAIERTRALPEPQLPSAIAAIQKQLAMPGLPLREKRYAQSAIAELQTKFKAWEKTNKSQQGPSGAGANAVEAANRLLSDAPDLGGAKLVVGEIPNATDDALRSAIDSLKKKSPSLAVMLASSSDGKVTFIAAVSDDLIAKGLKAGDWVRETAKAAGGGGGGRPQMAQAGGKDPAKLPEALTIAREFAQKALS